MVQLGDLTVIDTAKMPGKLTKALAVIATSLHPLFDEQKWIAPGKSKESCVLCSAAVRDFLFSVGFADVQLRPCALIMRAFEHGTTRELHSLGIGMKDVKVEVTPDRWNGHMVVTVPSAGWLIDTTLYQAQREVWPELTGMMAVPLSRKRKALASVAHLGDKVDFDAIWLASRANGVWHTAPDLQPWRRAVVAAALRERFGPWRDTA